MTSLKLTCSKCKTQAELRGISYTCKLQLDYSNLVKQNLLDKNETPKKLRNS